MNSGIISQSNKQALRNPWVLGWITLILVVLLVNIVMITLAIVTNSGLVEEDYYQKGRDLERNILKRRTALHALGWHFKLDVPEELVLGKASTLRFNVVDRQGLAVDDLTVKLQAYRSSDANADFRLAMQNFAPGQYQVKAVFALKGYWELRLKVSQAGKNYNLIDKRIFVKPN